MVTLKLPFRLSDGQSRPFHSSWVASTDCTNVTLGQANLILTQRVGEDHYGQNELQRVKSEILREETLAAHNPPPKKNRLTYAVRLFPGVTGLCYMLDRYHSAEISIKGMSLLRCLKT